MQLNKKYIHVRERTCTHVYMYTCMYVHVHYQTHRRELVNRAKWRMLCSVCATGARVAQPVPCNFVILFVLQVSPAPSQLLFQLGRVYTSTVVVPSPVPDRCTYGRRGLEQKKIKFYIHVSAVRNILICTSPRSFFSPKIRKQSFCAVHR
jgi:hypothetical protein